MQTYVFHWMKKTFAQLKKREAKHNLGSEERRAFLDKIRIIRDSRISSAERIQFCTNEMLNGKHDKDWHYPLVVKELQEESQASKNKSAKTLDTPIQVTKIGLQPMFRLPKGITKATGKPTDATEERATTTTSLLP